MYTASATNVTLKIPLQERNKGEQDDFKVMGLFK
jgi:hypothetical protein